MIGSRLEKDFVDSVVSSNLLAEAIDWIQSNLEPEDVFSEKQLGDWAAENDYVKEV